MSIAFCAIRLTPTDLTINPKKDNPEMCVILNGEFENSFKSY